MTTDELRIPYDDARMLAYTDSNEYFNWIAEEVSDSGRWQEYVTTVFLVPGSPGYLAFSWARGLTENQEDDIWSENGMVEVFEVVPYEVRETRYREVK